MSAGLDFFLEKKNIKSQSRRTLHSFDKPSIQYQSTILKESEKTGADRSEDEGNFELEETRKYLESSWNKKTMGNVPSTPESAAVAAGERYINLCNL